MNEESRKSSLESNKKGKLQALIFNRNKISMAKIAINSKTKIDENNTDLTAVLDARPLESVTQSAQPMSIEGS